MSMQIVPDAHGLAVPFTIIMWVGFSLVLPLLYDIQAQ